MTTPAPSENRAVIYLRVSTPSQVRTDYDPEGISIPAQRVACENKARQLGLDIVAEYIEPGVTGTSMAKRVEFQRMLERIRAERDVSYVICYKLSRVNRNWEESAFVIAALRRSKATLISATENIDDTPVGRLTLGMLSAINEFRSAEDGADIRYKMGEKAKKGGTISRAPIGYLNSRQEFEGRMVAVAAPDPVRGQFIRQVFELYATGDYTLDVLQQTITDIGLRTRGTRRWPPAPVSRTTLRNLLSDRYYLGIVEHEGIEYPGRHEALVSRELFDRVQTVIEERSRRGNRERIHQHHLKGLLFCARCRSAGRESRLIYTEVKGRSAFYFYYLCRGRQLGLCDLPHLPVDLVENQVASTFATLNLTESIRVRIRNNMHAATTDAHGLAEQIRRQLKNELRRIDAAQTRLVDLAADGQMPTAKIRSRLTDLDLDRQRITKELTKAVPDLSAAATALDEAIDLLAEPRRIYEGNSENGKRLLCQAFYERLWVGEGDVPAAIVRQPFDDLSAVSTWWSSDHSELGDSLKREVQRRATSSPQGMPAKPHPNHRPSLAMAAGSSKSVMVDAVGRYSKTPYVLKRLRRTQRLGHIRARRPVSASTRVHAVDRRLDETTRQQLIDDYRAGSPTTALMERYDLGKGTVLGILHRAGVDLRNQGLGPSDLPRAVALYESGLSLKRVAEQVACDAETVRKALKAAGVELRKPWDRFKATSPDGAAGARMN